MKAGTTVKTQIETGFIKRLLNSFNKHRYEKKKKVQELYMHNWEKVKWRYRVGKLFFISSLFFVGKYFLVDRYLTPEQNERDSDELKAQFREYLHSQWGVYGATDYYEIYKQKFEGVGKLVKVYLDKNITEKTVKRNKEYDFLYNVLKVLRENVNSDKMRENDYFSYLDHLETPLSFNNLFFINMQKLYNKQELITHSDNLTNFAENEYKKMLCWVVPTKLFMLSPNLISEFSLPEEVAFVLSFNLMEFFGNINFYKVIETDFYNYFDKINNINNKYLDGKYIEDFKNILNDIKTQGNIQGNLIYNPFLIINFDKENKEFINVLTERQLEVNLKKISLALDLMKCAGFDIRKLTDFDFDSIYYRILDLTDKDNEMKSKMERYLKKKINELAKAKEIESSLKNESLLSQWDNIKYFSRRMNKL